MSTPDGPADGRNELDGMPALWVRAADAKEVRTYRNMARSKAGIGAGPKCKVCQKIYADSEKTICYRCAQTFKDADYIACSPTLIKADMMRTGIPVIGKAASFNRNLFLQALARRHGTGLMAVLGFRN